MLSHHGSVFDRLESTGLRAGADIGEPMTGLAEMYSAADSSAGLWECSPGGWHIESRPNTEFVHILSGRVRMTDDADGSRREIGPGDLMVLPKGWSGRWDILETTKKFYVIVP